MKEFTMSSLWSVVDNCFSQLPSETKNVSQNAEMIYSRNIPKPSAMVLLFFPVLIKLANASTSVFLGENVIGFFKDNMS